MFEHQFRVRYHECDVQARVYNANYQVYCDIGSTELWRDAGISWADMMDRGHDTVLAESTLRFKAPAEYDDVLTIQVAVARLGRTSIELVFRLLRGDLLLVEGEQRHVVVATETWQPDPVPDWLRERLAPYIPNASEAP